MADAFRALASWSTRARLAYLGGLLAVLFLLGGCAQARPRFGQDVATALAADDMRRLETPDMRLYYPAKDREEALRVAGRLEGCLGELRRRARVKNRSTREKANVLLPSLPLNNAYVMPAALGSEHVAVLSTYETSDIFGVLGLPPDPSTIGCHEMVHYVHVRQIEALPKTAEAIFGYLLSPQIGLDSWFWEGMATFYETRLQGGVGRLGSAYWTGAFASGVAERGLHESDLHELTRRVPFAAPYLVGSHFVDWLVRKWGEPTLWEIIERQSDEVAFPLGVSGRFSRTYGKSLAGLYADFAAESAARFPKRPRGLAEREVRALDQAARYAVAPDGTEAILEQGMDVPMRLTVILPDGRVAFTRDLTDVLPGRDLVAPTVYGASGLSFTADGKSLYWVNLDQGKTFQESRLLRFDVASGALEVVRRDLGGAGGSISPDGRTYVFSLARGDTWQLAALDLGTRAVRTISSWGPRVFIGGARFSPDGRRLAATFYTDKGLDARVLDAKTGRVLAKLAVAGQSTEPSWEDDDHVLFVGEHEGRLQVFRATLSTRQIERLSDAPYVAFSPFSRGGKVRFLSRSGWGWSLDELDVASARSAPSSASAPPGSSVAAAGVDAAGATLGAASPESPAPRSEAARTAGGPYDAKVELLDDAPYANDGLFVPTLRGPSAVAIAHVSTVVGMGITGGDRLGFHRWGLEASWDTTASEPSAAIQYINTELAPVFVTMRASRTGIQDRVSVPTPTGEEETRRTIRKETTANIAASRTFWTTEVASGFRFDELDDSIVSYASASPHLRRAAGPYVLVAYDAHETTLAAGVRRALVVTASGAAFPALTAPAFGDTRIDVRVTTPLPLSRRHTLTLAARGRALPGLPTRLPFLEVGGASQAVFAGAPSATPATEGSPNAYLPPALSFVEPLRGFEDLGLVGTRVAIADATYRFPIVLDTGSISTIHILPSFLLRQIDLEAFGTGATLLEQGREPGAAVGGAAIARLAFWRVPFGLGIQVARRLTLDEAVSVSFAGGAAQ